MRRELDIHGLRSRVRTGRSTPGASPPGRLTDAFLRRPRLTVEFAVDARCRRDRAAPVGRKQPEPIPACGGGNP